MRCPPLPLLLAGEGWGEGSSATRYNWACVEISKIKIKRLPIKR